MSRKKQKRDAVPVEILAEGSGPVGEAAVPEVIEPAAAKPVKRRGRKVGEVDDVEIAAEPAPGRGKRGKRRPTKAAEVAPGDEIAGADDNDGDVIEGADEASGDTADDGMEASGDADDGMEASGDAADDGMDMSGDAADIGSDASGEATDDGIDVSEDATDDVSADAMDGGMDASGDAMESSGDAIEASGDATSGDAMEPGEGTDADPDAPEGSGEAPVPAAMDAVQLRHLVEALIFATDKPITLQRLRQLTRVSDVRRLEQALTELAEDYRERGIALHQVSGGYQFRTNTQYSGWVQQLIAGRPVRLSRAQLETLAIVAYRQPITRPEIDEIRGVDSSATLRLLLDRALIRVLGKREEVGRPMLYGTTKEFLDFFSLGDLRELPTLREYSELTAESRQVMSDRLGVPLAPDASPSEDAFVAPAEAATEDVLVHEGRTDGEAAHVMASALADDATAGDTMFATAASHAPSDDELASPDHALVDSLGSDDEGDSTMACDASVGDEPLPAEHEPMATEHEPMSVEHEPMAAEHEPLSAEHEPIALDHEPIAMATEHEAMSVEHEPMATEHEPMSVEHEPMLAEHEPVTAEPMISSAHGDELERSARAIASDEPGELEGSYPAAHRHVGDLDSDRDDDAAEVMGNSAFESGPADDHVDEPGE